MEANEFQPIRKGKGKEKLRKDDKRKLFKKFIDSHLQRDGVFLLTLININAGELTSAHITARLWTIYLKNAESLKELTSIKSRDVPFQ